jgi:hypothetical protein
MTQDAYAPPPKEMTNSQLEIAKVCDEIKDLLLSKNEKYGDSALQPARIFSKSTPVEQILVRIDDKLSRIQKGAGLLASDEDVVSDLIGYLVLLKIALKRQSPLIPQQFFSVGSDDIISFTGLSSSAISQWDGTDIDGSQDFYFQGLGLERTD